MLFGEVVNARGTGNASGLAVHPRLSNCISLTGNTSNARYSRQDSRKIQGTEMVIFFDRYVTWTVKCKRKGDYLKDDVDCYIIDD